MIKKAAAAALKYAGGKMVANAAKKAKKGAKRLQAAGRKVTGKKLLNREERENPGYQEGGATEDLFGGPSRRLPKKQPEFHRPRVKIRGSVVTFAKRSPYKERVEIANPAARVVVAPLRVVLDAAEVRTLEDGRWPSDSMVRKILSQADKRRGWDHVEAVDKNGRHLFDLIP